MKQCKKCLEEKDLECFPINKHCRGGRANSCRQCLYKRRKEVQTKNGSYYTKHREKALERAKRPDIKERRRELYYKKLGRPVPEKKSLWSDRMKHLPTLPYPQINSLYKCYFTRILCGLKRRRDSIPRYTDLNPEILHILMTLQDFKCSYTNRHISLEDSTASLDRIDNTKGYTVDNVQWVHKDINFMKGPLSHKVFCELCKDVAEHQKS